MSRINKHSNFIEFINHLLTFNKQQELFQQKQNSNIDREVNLDSQLGTNDLPFRFNISASVVVRICHIVLEIFRAESNILNIEAPLHIFGDIHGQFIDII